MTTLKNIDNNAPIAFFDSGIGGLTVLNKVKAILPDEKFLYYGDTLHMPYGEKTKEQLLEYSDNIFKFFETKASILDESFKHSLKVQKLLLWLVIQLLLLSMKM